MNKQEFLTCLQEGLADLPPEETGERLAFYRDMIEDRVEDGLSEDDAVAEIGPVEAIVAQLRAESSSVPTEQPPSREKRRLSAGEILLLVLGFPLWFPLLIAAGAILLSVLIVLWSLVLSLWAVAISLLVGALGGAAAAVLSFFRGDSAGAVAVLGAGLLLAGLSILLFFACKAASKGALQLTKRVPGWIRSLFHRKEKAA